MEAIGAGIEACLRPEASIEVRRVSIVPDRISPAIVETSSSADEWIEGDPTMLPAEAARHAAEYNASLARRATMAKDGLLTWATEKIRGRRPHLLRQLLVGAVPPELLAYGAAQWREADYEWLSGVPDSDRIDVRLASVALSGLDTWGSAKEQAVRIEDDVLERRLTLRYLGDELRHINFDVSPAAPGLVGRLVTAFGEDTRQLMVWVAGAFHDEAELDAGLATFAAAHPQMSAGELREILSEVRAQGIAANKAMPLEGPEFFLPDTEQLDEVIKLLG